MRRKVLPFGPVAEGFVEGVSGAVGSQRAPLYVRIAEELEAAIVGGRYPKGGRLPPEYALADEYGVHRHTVRRALDRLQGRGLIHRVKGHGAYAAPGRIEHQLAWKTSFSGSIKSLGLESSQKVLGVRRVGAYGRLVRELAVGPGEPLVVLERVHYGDDVPLAVSEKYHPESVFPGLYERLKGHSFFSSREVLRQHYDQELYRAHSIIEVEPSDSYAARHLRVPLGLPLFKIDSLDVLEDDTPAEWGTGRFRSDAMKLRVTVRGEIAEPIEARA